MKHNFYFLLMLAIAGSFLVGVFYLISPSLAISLFPFLQGLSLIVIIIYLIGCAMLFSMIGSQYAKTKEAETFNEFGVRKKNAKRKLSSQRREQIEAMQLANIESIVSQAELKKAIHKGSDFPEEDLEKMIGLDSVKEKVLSLKARMEFDIKTKDFTGYKEMHHMVFYGSAGTGKTTVARIMTGLFYDYGYIDENKILEINGSFLMGKNTADTEKKVRIIVSQAKGGVLFIDEAYALVQSKDGVGNIAITTLIQEMENNKENLIVIFAGYQHEIASMLGSNPGFRSRIKDYIEFPNYDFQSLLDIAMAIAKDKGFSIDDEAMKNLLDRLYNEKHEKSWGNGRTVRNVIEESIDNHAYNYQTGKLSKADRYTLCACDISTSVQKYI